MGKKTIKNILILIIILYIFFINEKIQNIEHQKDLIVKKETKISVIIPIYNGGKYLNYSLRSVQNQKMKDIEIIIVDDNSNDDSLEIIQNYMKSDKRIKLIKNKENRKILFCKSLGALNSKGKFIIELDQDDMFVGDDCFDIILKQSEKYELDLLRFGVQSGNDSFEISKINNYRKKINFIQKQPKLKSSVFKKNICLLWGNLIKSDLYKIVIYNLWPIIINYQIIFQEDFLITFFILIYAQKFGKIKGNFLFHLINIKSASNDYRNNSEYYLSVIFVGIIFFDYYIDFFSQDIHILINYINFLKKDFKEIKEMFPSLFNHFFGKILSNNNLKNKDKKKLLKKYNISENCDSYLFLNESQSINLNRYPLINPYIQKPKDQSIELSLIIIGTNYEKIYKIINPINVRNYEFLEVILIYDGEDNKEYELLDNYIKSYYNIKLIDNGAKKGIVFSISEGAMIAKGKYLLILNQNFFFISNNTIQNIFQEIEREDADIVEFNLYKILPNNYINLYRCKHFVSKFNLTKIKYNYRFNNIDIKNELIANKLFRANFLKNIIEKFQLHKIEKIIDLYYNDIFAFLIESSPHKYKYISSVSLYINDIDCDKPKFNDFTSGENKKINETIFYINFIYKYSNNTYESKENALYEFFNLLSIIYNKFTKNSNSSVQLLNKFINCKYISKSNKNLLKFYYNSLVK